ncbi:MAG: hypothetical protein AB1632_04430 [Nitrospirota bacterium]
MKGKFQFFYFFIAVFVLVLNTGCNREKAEAIKMAAEKFRIEASAAIEEINNLFLLSLSMPYEEGEEINKIALDLEREGQIDAEKLSFIMGEAGIGRATEEKVNQEFEKIKQGYYQFEVIFRSFPKGSLLAVEAVKKAEKHAINLTVQMINFADFLKKYPLQFTGRRSLIIEKITEAKLIQDQNLRREKLSLIAKSIVQLRYEEQKAKKEAILQCLKAAEAGKLVAELIRDYDSLSIEELLGSIRSTLSFIAEISSNRDAVSLLERYKSVETAIKEDPYWKAILSEKIIK